MLRPVRFDWLPEAKEDGGRTVGLIAQDVEDSPLGHLVQTSDESGLKRIRYDIELNMHLIAVKKSCAKL